MKTQKVAKSSKFTQVTPNDNDYRDCPNVGWTVLPASPLDEGNQNLERISYPEGHCQNVNRSSELLLKSNYEVFKNQEAAHEISRCSPERNANRYPSQDIELCNCITPIYQKTRFVDQCSKGGHPQTMTLNRSFGSVPKMDSNLSLDRKTGKFTRSRAEPQRIFRVQSPEIINIHRGPFFDGRAAIEGGVCSMGEFNGKEHEFRRGHSVRAVGTRGGSILGISSGHQKRRAAGDGMDAEMDDPELVFEMSSSAAGAPGHMGVGVGGECQCPCDHVVYSPMAYAACLQDERPFGPAPDVTRRMGSSTPLGKAEPPGSPPYYRSTSATSSSSNSASSRGIDLSSRHWWLIGTVLLLAAAAGVGVPIALKISSSASFEERLEFATRLLQEVPLIDGHNDLPWNIRKFLHNKLKNFKFNEDLRSVSPWSTSAWSHTDLMRLEQGHVAAQVSATFKPLNH